jgi:hypothetical protein
MDPGSGGTFMFRNVNQHYRSPSFAAPERLTGTIAVALVRVEADGGLVVRISDRPSASSASADPPLTCVAFGDTTVVCDPSRAATPEEVTLLKFLGKGFVDAARLDAARHWHVDGAGTAGARADYTIAREDGTTLDITESSVRPPSGSHARAEIAASIR